MTRFLYYNLILSTFGNYTLVGGVLVYLVVRWARIKCTCVADLVEGLVDIVRLVKISIHLLVRLIYRELEANTSNYAKADSYDQVLLDLVVEESPEQGLTSSCYFVSHFTKKSQVFETNYVMIKVCRFSNDSLAGD